MTALFDPTRAWRRNLDVRHWDDWEDRLRGFPNGAFWSVVGPRRSGKSWALHAIRDRCRDILGTAHLIDLRQPNWLDAIKNTNCICILLDEPGYYTQSEELARQLISDCARYRQQNVKIVMTMSPREWSFLSMADTHGYSVQARDLLPLAPLNATQARKLARQSWAEGLLDQLDPSWQRNAFLLELLFSIAEKQPDWRSKPTALCTEVIEQCRFEQYNYVETVFNEGLAEAHRDILRRVAQRQDADYDGTVRLLENCGLLWQRDTRLEIADPVLAAHLPPPLIIHHISDVHFGRKSARAVDQKAHGRHAERLSQAAGYDYVRDTYRAHLSAQAGRNNGPHLIFISGDLAEQAREEEFAQARAWIESLQEHLALHPDLHERDPRVLLVGGNHDVDWTKTAAADHEIRARHLSFAQAFEGFEYPRLEQPPQTRPPKIIRYLTLEVALLGSSELGGEEADSESQKELLELLEHWLTRARDAFEKDELERYKALRVQVNRIDPAIVHHLDLERLEQHNWNRPVRIAVLHHPVSPTPTAPEIADIGGLINAGAVKSALFRTGIDLVLHGHQHSGWFATETWPELYGERRLHIAAAPSLGSFEIPEARGFNEIRVFREGTKNWRVEFQRFVEKSGGWLPSGPPISFVPGLGRARPRT